MIGRRSERDAQSFDDAWSGRTPQDSQTADLVRTAELLCEAAVVEPSASFQADLRERLMTEAATVLVPTRTSDRPAAHPSPRPHPLRRRLAGLTAAAVASAGVIGLVTSSAEAVPGEMLYPVKRGVESVELALHRDDASRGSFQLAQASERLAEARELSEKKPSRSTELVASTLADFSSQAESGSTALFSDFTDKGTTRSIDTVNDFAAAASAELGVLSNLLPAGANDSLRTAAKTVTNLATQASALCTSCDDANVQPLAGAVSDVSDLATTDDSEFDVDTATVPGATIAPGSGKTSPSTSEPTKKPIIALPTTPTPSTDPVTLGTVTEPLLGALLGDDDQVGLVPGLLNALLGGGKN